jgi:GNAT superfamily N-acetyltransferase
VSVRRASAADAGAVAKLLYDFNTEYDDPTPEPAQLAGRIRELLGRDMIVLLAGDGPDGLAVLRLRPSLWSAGRECYLAELYVAPARRGHGLGRALMESAIEVAQRGRHSWTSAPARTTSPRGRVRPGFTNREGPDGPIVPSTSARL